MTASTAEQAIAAAGEAYADAVERLNTRAPRDAARAAWLPGGPSVDELEARIRARRGLALGRAS